MRVAGWSIDGFGIFCGDEVHGLHDGLTVFLGPNEAGKSTLLAFLRAALFGFPVGKKGKALYPPLAGGRHGGRVVLETSDGQIMVERFQGAKWPNVLLPDGTEGAEDDVHRVFGGVDGTVFASVFAFSLDELRDFDSLSSEGIRDRIFSAGIAGAGRSARQVVGLLEKQGLELLRPRAGGRINGLLDRIEELEAELAEARSIAQSYPDIVLREQAAESRVDQVGRETAAFRTKQRRAEVLLELWPVWVERRQQAEADLAQLKAPQSFPADAEERLGKALTAMETAATSVEAARREIEGRRAQRAQLEPSLNDRLANVAAEAAAHAGLVALHRTRLSALPALQQELSALEGSFHRKTADLGAGWDEAGLGALDASLPVGEEVESWSALLSSREAEVSEAHHDAQAARKQLLEAGEALKARRLALAGIPQHDEVLVNTEESAVRRLRANLQELGIVDASSRSGQALLNERRRDLADREALAVTATRGALRVPGALAVVGLLALMACLWAFLSGTQGLAILLLLITLFAGVGAVVTYRASRPGHTRPSPAVQEIEALRDEVARLARDVEIDDKKAEGLRAQILGDQKLLGLEDTPSFQRLEELAKQAETQRLELQRWRDAEAQVQEMGAICEKASGEDERAGAALEEVGSRISTDQEAWHAWQRGHSIPEELSPEGVTRFLQLAREARDLAAQAAGKSSELSDLGVAIVDWENEARRLLEEAARPSPQLRGQELVSALLRLEEDCRIEGQAQAKCSSLDELLTESQGRLEEGYARAGEAKRVRDGLFAEAGAENESAFRERMAVHKRARELRTTIEDRERQLIGRLGAGDDAEALRRELAEGNVGMWESEQEAAGTDLEALERDHTEAIEDRAEVRRQREALEFSADVAGKEGELEQAMTQLESALREWRVVRLAEALVEDTLAEFTRARQPEVLKEASTAFSRVTEGRYQRLVQTEDSSSIVVISESGQRKTPDELSRGTLEQLYLCLRLGLAAEYARRTVSVPLVMDDVLVNFDPRRARRVGEILLDFASQHQVLLFTCHPDTAELLSELGMRNDIRTMGGVEPAAP